MRKPLVPVLLAFLCVCGLMVGRSAADELEKGLHKDLLESKLAAKQAGVKLRSGKAPTEQTAHLQSIAEKVRASQLLMEERFNARAEQTALLGGKAAQRQEAVAAEFAKALEDFLARIDAIPPDGTVSPATLDELKALLDRLVTPKKRPLLGTLPYKHLGYPAREPATSPIIVPAYKGGNRTVIPADTAATPEAPLSKEIVDLAQSLQWNPVLIYEWVKNNVETEWYFGVMKGAEETLRQKSGNDADQAALLVSMLRASGFPARFVKGAIEFFPGIDKVKSLIGIDDPLKIAAFFQKAGIPFKPVIAGGKIANFQVEHVWVESQIPYSNYRGAVIDDMGKSWLGLDTSIKPPGLAWNQPLEIPGFPFDTMRDEYLQAVQAVTPLEFVKAKAEEYLAQNNPGKSWQDLLQTKKIIPDILNIIPASLQFRQIAITGEYTELPAELKQKVRFTATAGDNELFAVTLETSSLSNRKILLSYEPETVEDQQIIDSFGSLDNTPSYLVRLRPVLKLGEERLVVARDGLPMGDDYILAIEATSPNGTERTVSSQIAGNLSVIGVVSQKVIKPAGIPLEEKDAGQLLYEEALGYIDRWNHAEDELAALLKVTVSRPVPAVTVVGGVIEVTRLLDIPHSFEWQGVFIDASLRRVETAAKNGDASRELSFMRLSALQGSVLEHRIFEDDFKVDAVSTARLLQLAKAGGMPILTIERNNVDTILPSLSFDNAVKQDIADAVNQGLTVTIPQTEISYQDWTGVGYVKENKETGESGWMLSGSIAGGMTALNKQKWFDESLVNMMSLPYSPLPNTNPEAVTKLRRVTDYTDGIAGEAADRPIMVMALDNNNRPVQKVPVTFRAVAGGGTLQGINKRGAAITTPGTEVVVKTEKDGIARVRLTLGEHTSDSPYYVHADPESILVGQNLVSAFTPKGSGIISIDKTIEALGYPGATADLLIVAPAQTDNLWGNVNTYSGPAWVKPVDRRGNPVSNKIVSFSAGPPESLLAPPLPTNLNVLFFGNGSACPGIPTRTCPNVVNELNKYSDSSGAYAGVILGDTDNTHYSIIATVSGDTVDENLVRRENGVVFSMELDHYSLPVVKDGSVTNRSYISVLGLQHLDENGNRIDAGLAGVAMSSQLETMLFLHEEIDRSIGSFKTKQVSSGKVDYSVSSGGGSVSPKTATPSPDGTFLTTLTPGAVPAVNKITALATATVTLASGETKTLSDATTLRIWGVKPEVVPNQEIYVNSYGYPEADTKLGFTVSPADYQGYSRYFIIYEDGAYMGFVPADKDFALLTQGGAKFDIRKKYTAQLVLNWGTKQEIKSSIVPLNVTMLCLIPDYDHNRRIDYADRARALKKDKYYFWVNDDDGTGDVEGTGIPGTRLPATYNRVNGTRDLVDWFPVQVDLSGLTSSFAPGSYTYRLKNADGALSLVLSWLYASESGKYLTDVATALNRANVLSQSITATGLTLDAAQMQVLTGGKDVVLLEARKPTQQPLVIEISDSSGNLVYTSSLSLSMAGVEQMFRHKSLTREMYWEYLSTTPRWTGVTPVAGHPIPVDAFNESMPDRLKASDFSDAAHFSGFDADNDGKDFVHVHGYNVNGQDARGEQSEVFKRLYWSGSRARFWGVTWFGWDSQFDLVPQIQSFVFGRKRSPNYHVNIRHAFNAGKLLKLFVASQNLGKATISAHSLGNMVVSTAIQEGMQYGRYLMTNAAVAEEAYIEQNNYDLEGGWDKATRQLMYSPDWRYPGGSDTRYEPFLWQSEWYQLFRNNDDERYRLTWRNNFSNVRNSNVYAYYASTDEAFRPFKLSLEDVATATSVDDPIIYNGEKSKGSYMWTLIQNFLKLSDPEQVGTYAFSFNELMKGTETNPYFLTSDSKYGGWGFNTNVNDGYYTSCIDPTGDCGQMKPDDANKIANNKAILKTRPLFNKNPDNTALFGSVKNFSLLF